MHFIDAELRRDSFRRRQSVTSGHDDPNARSL